MRAIYLFLLLISAVVCADNAFAQWPATTSTCEGRFWIEGGATAFDRPGGKLGLALISNDVTKAPLFTSDQLTDLNGAVGPNFRFGSKLNSWLDWEASTTMGKWETNREFLGPDLVSPFLDPQLDPNTINIDYISEFWDLQFNFRKAVYPGLTWICGPRYFQMNEDLRLRTQSTIATPGGAIDFRSLNTLDVDNSAIGGTIGFEFNQPISRAIYIQSHIKASGLANKGTLTRLADTNEVTPETTDSIDKSSGMFIGQTGIRAYFELFPRQLATYAGYQANWVDGVATAPSQDLTVGGAEMKNSNTIFWHSIDFGMRFTY